MTPVRMSRSVLWAATLYLAGLAAMATVSGLLHLLFHQLKSKLPI